MLFNISDHLLIAKFTNCQNLPMFHYKKRDCVTSVINCSLQIANEKTPHPNPSPKERDFESFLIENSAVLTFLHCIFLNIFK